VAGLIDLQQHELGESFPNGTFDLVSAHFLHSTIEMDRPAILRRAAAAVAPGGSLLIVDHAAAPPWAGEHVHEHHFATAEEVLAGLGLDEQQWELLRLGTAERDAVGPDGQAEVRETQHARLEWQSTLDAEVVAAAVLPLATMSTLDLFRYVRHLDENEQASQRYEIQFWKRALYPFACLVMIALALPFAYMHARSGGISLKVFGGIMLGISFVLLNSLASHVGQLVNWTPWIVASAPSAFYLLLSMAAFAWLVRYR